MFNLDRAGKLMLVVLLTPLAGCIGWWGPVDIEFAVSQSAGMSLSKEIGVNVGPVMIGLAGVFVGDEFPVKLSDISNVDVGVYRVRSSSRHSLREMRLPGWERMVRVREDDGDVLVFVRVRGDAVRGLLVVARDGEELIIAKIRGRLDAMIENALRRTDGGFDWKGVADVSVN